MRIYGIYKNNATEDCLFVGTIHEIANYLGRDKNSIYSGITHNKVERENKIRKYNIISLYNESKGENEI